MILTDRQVSYALNDCRIAQLFTGTTHLEPLVALDQQIVQRSYLRPEPVFVPAPQPQPGLRPHAHLRLLPLDDSHVVAFVPSISQIAVLNQAAVALLQQLPVAAQDALPEIAYLHALGLLTNDDRAAPEPEEPQVLAAWLHVSNACNLRCSYCYIQKNHEHMDAATARAAIDAVVRSALHHGYCGVVLKYAGGEPLLNLAVIAEAHHYAIEQAAIHHLALQASVLSNGAILNSAHVQQLQALGLGLTISLDSLDESHNQQRPTRSGGNSLGAVVAGIECAIAGGLRPAIAVTATAANLHGLPELVAWLLERDLEFTLSFARDAGCGATMLDLRAEEARIIAALRRVYAVIAANPPAWSVLNALLDRADLSRPHSLPCSAGKHYLVIDQHGGVAKCQMTIRESVASIRDHDPLATLRASNTGLQNIPVDQRAGCRSCEWKYWCAGGCPIATFRATGRYDIQSPNCGIYQALYPDLIRLEGIRILQRAQWPV
ncbi:MAG: SPASM domain-containing protein [Oscillochloris sp.]|nr:SPASM domain-containing protein [Oscillochloris sp.]